MRLSVATGGMATAAIATLALALAAGPAIANINLELRALPEPCSSQYVQIDLYAVSDSSQNQSIAAMDVILVWDPTVLKLLGVGQVGQYPYNWLFSGFPNDHALDGLNDTWDDGNALYEALAQLGSPAWATPDGLRVVTFKFKKLIVGHPTLVDIDEGGPPKYQYTWTVVYDGVVPGKNVTGTLTGVDVVPGTRGDLNCDDRIGFGDINPFVLRLSDPAAYTDKFPNCPNENGDINCDGRVDFGDINPFVALLSGG